MKIPALAGLLLFAFSAFTAMVPATCRADVVEIIVAVVNGHIITRSEVEKTLERAGVTIPTPEHHELALQNLVEKALVETAAAKYRIEITDKEVNEAINSIRQRMGVDPLTMRSQIEERGFSWEEYKESIRGELLRSRAFGYAMRAEMKVGEDRLREYYLKNAQDFAASGSVRLLHVMVKGAEGAQMLAGVRTRVLAGEDFATVAKEVIGAEPTDTGSIDLGGLNDAFRDLLVGVEPGQVSFVTEQSGAYHIFKVLERAEGGVRPFEEVAEEVAAKFAREGEQKLFRSWIEQLKRKADIEIKP